MSSACRFDIVVSITLLGLVLAACGPPVRTTCYESTTYTTEHLTDETPACISVGSIDDRPTNTPGIRIENNCATGVVFRARDCEACQKEMFINANDTAFLDLMTDDNDSDRTVEWTYDWTMKDIRGPDAAGSSDTSSSRDSGGTTDAGMTGDAGTDAGMDADAGSEERTGILTLEVVRNTEQQGSDCG